MTSIFPDLPKLADASPEDLKEDFARISDVIRELHNLELHMNQHLRGKYELSSEEFELGCALFYFWHGWQNAKKKADEERLKESPIAGPKPKKIITIN